MFTSKWRLFTMKKLVVVGALSILLAGCGNDDSEKEANVPVDDSSTLEEQNTINTPPEDNEEAEEQASENSNNSSTEENVESDETSQPEDNELAGYEEYATILDVAEVEGMKGIVETDNPGTRVILFEDETGKKTVKSVYVKKENRLKVISLDDDGLLYNGIIK